MYGTNASFKAWLGELERRDALADARKELAEKEDAQEQEGSAPGMRQDL